MIMQWDEFRKWSHKLSEKGYIPIFDEMNMQLAEVAAECIFNSSIAGKKKLTLLINSNGGWNASLSTITAAMLQSGISFKGTVMGVAYSNAFHLLQRCDERVAVADSRLMFHWGWQRIDNQFLASIIAGETWAIEHIVNVELTAAEFVSQRTGILVEDLTRFAHQERYFTASEALKYNMIDRVLEKPPKVPKV